MISRRFAEWLTCLLLATGMVALLPAAARAQGGGLGNVHLRWNACYGDAGVANRQFACDTNSGTETLVVSATPPVDLNQFGTASIVMDILPLDPTLASWWQFQPGGCRASALSASFVPPAGSSSCVDPWQGQASGGVSFTYPIPGGPMWGRLRAIAAIPGRTVLLSGQEVFLFSLAISRSKTLGAGSCLGCGAAICLGLNTVSLEQPIGVGDVMLVRPAPDTDSDVVTWQADAVMRRGYFLSAGSGWYKVFSCLSVTEVQRPTWGAIKRLYLR